MLKKKLFALLLTVAMTGSLLAGCGSSADTAASGDAAASVADTETESGDAASSEKSGDVVLEDGIYLVDFDTDSSMFHVNEACNGQGSLTVKDGSMTVHISLVSKKILNLYPGLAEDAQKEGALLLEPTLDEVTYSDGFSEEVFGFDVPVPYLDEEFDLALVGEKGTWYDHKVSVSNPQPCGSDEKETEKTSDSSDADGELIVVASKMTVDQLELADGTYQIGVKLEGGSGKATVDSPCTLRIEDGKATAVITWSSPYYDYMIVGGEEYQPVNTEGNSVFEIPVETFGVPMEVQADTIAMSKPHLIDYSLTFGGDR